MASPECTHHSNARGGRPKSDQSRASGWHVIRWAEALYIENILIENVPEYIKWGPLDENGNAIKGKQGKTFLAFINALEALDYNVDWRIINCADYGDATIRKRLYIQARRNGVPVWPEPTHAPREKLKDNPQRTLFGENRKPYRSAREIIDWSIQGTSIYGRGKPLSENTLKRIEAGLNRYGLKLPEPFIFEMNHGKDDHRIHPMGEPMPTVTSADVFGLAEPYLVTVTHGKGDVRSYPIDKPLPTLSAKNGFALAEPYIVSLKGTDERQMAGSARSIDDPVPAITAGGGHVAVVQPFLTSYHGASYEGGDRARSVDEPLPAVATNNQFALVDPYVVSMLGEGEGHEHRVRSVDEPVPTVVGSNVIGLVQPYLVEYHSNGDARSVDEPLPTITTKDRVGIAQPVLLKDKHGKTYMLDIRFRMLQPHELAAAMSFPEEYEFLGTRADKVKQIGNAVPVNTAAALVATMI